MTTTRLISVLRGLCILLTGSAIGMMIAPRAERTVINERMCSTLDDAALAIRGKLEGLRCESVDVSCKPPSVNAGFRE